MMLSKEEIAGIKSRLAEAVVEKKRLTRERIALKRIPFKQRTSEQHSDMMRLIGLASDQKDVVRALQLAYAFARGRAYWTQERNAKLGATQGYLAAEISRIVPVQPADILSWMMAPVDDLARAAFAAHEQAARQAARAAKVGRTVEIARQKTREAAAAAE